MNERVSLAKRKGALKDVATVFLKLGILGFGGPAAHIAMMHTEVVEHRQWLTQEQFVDLVGATNLIPGPNSTEMAMHCGYQRAGWRGLIVAGLSFIMPAVVITGVLAWMYSLYGTLPEVRSFIYGIKPALIAVVVALMIDLARKSIRNTELVIIGVSGIVALLFSVSEIVVLFGSGLLGIALHRLKGTSAMLGFAMLPATAASSNGLLSTGMFWTFLKIGSILYGSGYVLFAFLDEELVQQGLLSRQVLTDAIAAGQITPGPVFSSATFIGWQMHGFEGALAATIGIFIPSFLFVALLNPMVRRLRRSSMMSAFLDAVNVASVVLVLGICLAMGKEAIADWRTSTIAAASFGVLMHYRRMNTAYIVLAGALVGWLLSLV